MPDPLQQIFTNLDRWRHLPNYQLERRFDIFLTPFLPQLLQEKTGRQIAPFVIPELPLKQGETNRSDKVDYVLFSAEGTTAFLVELKTDCGSLRAAQDEYLNRAAARQWSELLADLLSIVNATGSRRKYIHLLCLLQQAGQVQLAPELLRCFEKGVPAHFRCEWVEITTRVSSIEPIFITPVSFDGRTCITFANIRRLLGGKGDRFTDLIAQHLQRWECEAGSIRPEV